MYKNHGINTDILIEYCKSNTNISENIESVENLSVVENDIIYFKLKLKDNFITSLNSIEFSKYKIFERDYKLKNLNN